MVITQLSFDDGLCICSDSVRFSVPHQQSGWKKDGCKGFSVFRTLVSYMHAQTVTTGRIKDFSLVFTHV